MYITVSLYVTKENKSLYVTKENKSFKKKKKKKVGDQSLTVGLDH